MGSGGQVQMYGKWLHHEKTGGGGKLKFQVHFLVLFNIFYMQVGYKELCIHMDSDHGGLEEVMAKGEMEEIRELVEKIRRR